MAAESEAPRVLGRGNYGCVIGPALPCSSSSPARGARRDASGRFVSARPTVSKLFTNEETVNATIDADDELRLNRAAVRRAGPDYAAIVPAVGECHVDMAEVPLDVLKSCFPRRRITKKELESDSDHERRVHEYVTLHPQVPQVVFENAGISLDAFIKQRAADVSLEQLFAMMVPLAFTLSKIHRADDDGDGGGGGGGGGSAGVGSPRGSSPGDGGEESSSDDAAWRRSDGKAGRAFFPASHVHGHFDIKLPNIMVSDGGARFIDFGMLWSTVNEGAPYEYWPVDVTVKRLLQTLFAFPYVQSRRDQLVLKLKDDASTLEEVVALMHLTSWQSEYEICFELRAPYRNLNAYLRRTYKNVLGSKIMQLIGSEYENDRLIKTCLYLQLQAQDGAIAAVPSPAGVDTYMLALAIGEAGLAWFEANRGSPSLTRKSHIDWQAAVDYIFEPAIRSRALTTPFDLDQELRIITLHRE